MSDTTAMWILLVGIVIGWLTSLFDIIIFNPDKRLTLGEWVIVPRRRQKRKRIEYSALPENLENKNKMSVLKCCKCGKRHYESVRHCSCGHYNFTILYAGNSPHEYCSEHEIKTKYNSSESFYCPHIKCTLKRHINFWLNTRIELPRLVQTRKDVMREQKRLNYA